MNNKRFLPLITPLALLILNELVLVYPKLFFVVLSLGVLVIFFSVRYLGQGNKEKFWLSFSILPALIFLSFSIYSALLSSALFIQLFFLGAFVLNFYYLRSLYYYLVNKEYNYISQLDSFTVFSGVLIVFCLYASAFLLPLFINVSPAILAIAPFPVVWFLFLKGTWSSMLSFKDGLTILLINSLIIIQISWVLSYFPLDAKILGFMMSLVYYLLIILSLLNFKHNLNRKTLKWPLILVMASFTLLLLTARWL